MMRALIFGAVIAFATITAISALTTTFAADELSRTWQNPDNESPPEAAPPRPLRMRGMVPGTKSKATRAKMHSPALAANTRRSHGSTANCSGFSVPPVGSPMAPGSLSIQPEGKAPAVLRVDPRALSSRNIWRSRHPSLDYRSQAVSGRRSGALVRSASSHK